MAISNLVALAIMITTAATLHSSGVTEVHSIMGEFSHHRLLEAGGVDRQRR